VPPETLVHERLATDLQQQIEAAQLAAEQQPQAVAEPAPQIHLEHDHHDHEHHIEVREGHACSPDCPEHNHPTHSEHEDHHHEADHRIEHKAHSCSADCPEHGGHTHAKEMHNHEHEQHSEHRIEQKAHSCGADCAEHGHSHQAEHDHQAYTIEAKSAEHRCGADCPEHSHQHHEAHEHAATEHRPEKTTQVETEPIAQRAYNEVAARIRTTEATEVASRHHALEQEATQQIASTTREMPKAVEDAPVINAIDPERTYAEIAHAKTVEVEAAPEGVSDVATESITTTENEITSLAPLETGTAPIVEADLENRITEIVEQSPLEAFTLAPQVDQPIEPLAENVSETSMSDVTEAPDLAIETHLDTTSELDEVAAFELLDKFGIGPVTLPVFEQVVTPEAHAQPLAAVLEDGSASQPERNTSIAPSIDEALETLTTVLVERIDDIEAQLATAAPEQLQEIRKVLTNVRASLQLSREQGVVPENIQYQLIRLLQMLGFENPSQALTSYIQQYGISFVDELLARFFELLGQGRPFESLRVLQPQVSDDEDTTTVTKLGSIVLLFARLGGQFAKVA
jgi:hypothetical protein